ncbi:MAG TPA: response regulator transcription factor, partial [Pseudolysinimonas sp.]
EVLRGLRARKQRMPVLIATARDSVQQRIEGLDAGADDYVTKPFQADELLARIRALTRRTPEPGAEPVVTFGDVTVDLSAHVVHRAGTTVRLTPTEWKLLEVLVRNPGRLVTRETLLTEVWGPQYTTDTGYLRLLTEAGMGYRFAPES